MLGFASNEFIRYTLNVNRVCDFCDIGDGQVGLTTVQGFDGAVVCSNCMIAMHANIWHFLLEYLKRELKEINEFNVEFEPKNSMEDSVKQIARMLEKIKDPNSESYILRLNNCLEMIERIEEMAKDWELNGDQKVCKMNVVSKIQVPTSKDKKPNEAEEFKCHFCDKYESKVPLLFVGKETRKGICYYCIRPIGGDNRAGSDDVSLKQLVPQSVVNAIRKTATALKEITQPAG